MSSIGKHELQSASYDMPRLTRSFTVALATVMLLIVQPAQATMPQWALGRWIAVAVVQSAHTAEAGGAGYEAVLLDSLKSTQIEITEKSISGSFSALNSLTWGYHLAATVRMRSFADVIAPVADPVVIGTNITYDPDVGILSIDLVMEACGERGGHFISQVTPQLYSHAELREHCTGYSLFRFPDAEHLAIWLKQEGRGAGGVTLRNNGLVILERVPDHWVKH